jgi:hypothetical protein
LQKFLVVAGFSLRKKSKKHLKKRKLKLAATRKQKNQKPYATYGPRLPET